MCGAPIGDPTTGRVSITLSDGVARVLVFDLRSLFILEQVTGKSFIEAIQSPLSAEWIVAFVFAGLYGNAVDAGQEWSVDKLRAMIGDRVNHFVPLLSWALGIAMRRIAETPQEKEQKPSDDKWDWDKAIMAGCEILQLSPPQFWRLLPSHFDLMCRATASRLRNEHRFTAHLTANLMNCHLRRPITAAALMGERSPTQRFSDMTGQEQGTALQRVEEKLKQQRVVVQKTGEA